MLSNAKETMVSPGLARMMFNRMLQSWASDVLSLQKRGLDKPSFRRGRWYEETASGPWPFAEAKMNRAEAA